MRARLAVILLLASCAGGPSPATDAGLADAGVDAGPAVSGHNCTGGCWDGAHCQVDAPAACGTGDAPTCTVCPDPGPCRSHTCSSGACGTVANVGPVGGIPCGTNDAFLCDHGACGECLKACDDAHQTCLGNCHDAGCPAGCDQARDGCKSSC